MYEHPTKNLQDRTKARCVAAGVFFPNIIRESATDKYFQKARIPSQVSKYFWDKRISKIDEEESDLIRRNISYLFDGNVTVFSPGRFNTDEYGVLYTAKEAETAKKERFHYVSGRDKPFEYVVFSLSASGCLIDLRNYVDEQGRDLSQLPHSDCQDVAKQYRIEQNRPCVGIISLSARNPGGSCCTFFEIDQIEPGQILEHQQLEP